MILPLIFNDIALAVQFSSIFLDFFPVSLEALAKPETRKVESVPLDFRALNRLIKIYFFAIFFCSSADPAVYGFFTACIRSWR